MVMHGRLVHAAVARIAHRFMIFGDHPTLFVVSIDDHDTGYSGIAGKAFMVRTISPGSPRPMVIAHGVLDVLGVRGEQVGIARTL